MLNSDTAFSAIIGLIDLNCRVAWKKRLDPNIQGTAILADCATAKHRATLWLVAKSCQ
jgi:hypothetical protein